MDLYPLFNSLRVAFISLIIIFFLGLLVANYVSKAPKIIKGICDVVLTLPMVLPPTVTGYLLILFLGPYSLIGKFFLEYFNIRFTLVWYSGVISGIIVSFPLMYRSLRASFDSYDNNLSLSGFTLGLSRTCVFWKIKLPNCLEGIVSGSVLAFARSLGEYGATNMVAGYIPKRTATISTTVYNLWVVGDNRGALIWIIMNVFISIVFLFFINFFEKREKRIA